MGKKEATKESEPTESDSAATKRKAALEEIEVDVSAPEPPSKRAKRALKKGKTLPTKPSSDDDKENEDGTTESKTEKVRSEHGVWIGNLRFTVTPKELRQWLVDNSGGVLTEESVTRIKLPLVKAAGKEKEEHPTNKGFAYVDFADVSGKVAAIALSETEWHGRRLLIKDSKSYEGRPAKEKEAVEGGPKTDGSTTQRADAATKDAKASRKVFVGNLSFQVTEEDIWKNFEKCGEIESVKLATFEDSGKCKGFGWVKFKTSEGAEWAVKGFAKVKEPVETEADFQDDADKEDASKDPNQRQFKMRKWWVNRMFGRQLKLELAEDDQSRYKKRFGKDRPRAVAPTANGGRQDKRDRDPAAKEQEDQNGTVAVSKATSEKPIKTAKELEVARLKGQVVEHTGTKVTFD